MKQAILALIVLMLVTLASIVPWADAQQKPSNVLIWCQNTNGTSSPCLAGNSIDYDTGGGTVNQGTVGIALPASGGPVAGGTSTNPIRTDPTGTTTQPVSASSLPLPTGASTLAEQQTQTTALQLIDNLPLGQGAATSGQSGVLVQGAVTTAAPTYTTGNTNPISLQTDGSVRAAITNTPTVTANAGTGTFNIQANASTNLNQVAGNTISTGNGVAGTGTPRVTIASDNTAFTVNAAQSGTWTVQPGNTANTTPWLMDARGNVAHGAADSGNPVKVGCQARTTNRTAEVDADRVDCVADKNGQIVVTPMAPRERVVRSGVVTVSTTTETTLLAAGGAGVFRDLTYLKCTNNSATLVRVDLRDATAGTVIDSWALAASGGGFNIAFTTPYAQATANNNWTIQLSAAVTDVRCSAQAVEKN